MIRNPSNNIQVISLVKKTMTTFINLTSLKNLKNLVFFKSARLKNIVFCSLKVQNEWFVFENDRFSLNTK